VNHDEFRKQLLYLSFVVVKDTIIRKAVHCDAWLALADVSEEHTACHHYCSAWSYVSEDNHLHTFFVLSAICNLLKHEPNLNNTLFKNTVKNSKKLHHCQGKISWLIMYKEPTYILVKWRPNLLHPNVQLEIRDHKKFPLERQDLENYRLSVFVK
jgi:hypothetical protein